MPNTGIKAQHGIKSLLKKILKDCFQETTVTHEMIIELAGVKESWLVIFKYNVSKHEIESRIQNIGSTTDKVQINELDRIERYVPTIALGIKIPFMESGK